MATNFERIPSEDERKGQELMTAGQTKSSNLRERSLERIESKTGQPGRLEILRSKNPNGRFEVLIVGDLKGHKISLKCDSQRGPVVGGRLNDQEHFSGTIDGKDLSMYEARDLWVKYSGIAYKADEWVLPASQGTSESTREIVKYLLE
jgi:hypothetical protein